MSYERAVLDVDQTENISDVAARALDVANAHGCPVYFIYDGALALACAGWTVGYVVAYWAQVHRRVYSDDRVSPKVVPESLWCSDR